MNSPTLRNVKDVRSFMGLVGYCKRFIARFSKISHPITSLQRNYVKFEWIKKCEDNFRLLKKMLTSAPILKIIDLDKDFVLCIDA